MLLCVAKIAPLQSIAGIVYGNVLNARLSEVWQTTFLMSNVASDQTGALLTLCLVCFINAAENLSLAQSTVKIHNINSD